MLTMTSILRTNQKLNADLVVSTITAFTREAVKRMGQTSENSL